MKRLFQHIFFTCVAACMMCACISEENPGGPMEPEGNDIILNFTTGSETTSRAGTTPGVGVENAVSHLDVFIFNAVVNDKDDNVLYHHERIPVNDDSGAGKITLKEIKKDNFDPSTEYMVYVLANVKDENVRKNVAGNDTEYNTAFNVASIKTLSELKSLIQVNPDIHLTGMTDLSGTPNANVPQTFLMDGMAVLKENGSEKFVLNATGNTKNTELSVTLNRAAAKILVRIKKGDKVTFAPKSEAGNAKYYILNLPISGTLLPDDNKENPILPRQQSTSTGMTNFFKWGAETDTEDNITEITVKGYSYSHNWAGTSDVLTNRVRLVVNIPMSYDTEGTILTENWYQIPVCKDAVLERNYYYEVEVTVNVKGGISPESTTTLENIRYSARPMTEVNFSAGGSSNKAKYLTLNNTEMEMHNMDTDSKTMEFATSSEIDNDETTVIEAYYYNKYGQKTNVTTAEKNKIEITPVYDESGFSGKLTVYSPQPTNNTIRYIKVKVSNTDGITKEFLIRQFPLLYITNIQGWYSYRDDFKNDRSENSTSKPTTYEYAGDRIVGISYNESQNSYSYNTSISGFFRSKVVRSTYASDYSYEEYRGRSNIDYYQWNNSTSKGHSNSEDPGNAKMYHLRITATSNEYTLGKPRMLPAGASIDESYTDPSPENSLLVSPSFMIASRLGALWSSSLDLTYDNEEEKERILGIVREHCRQYVEVTEDGTEYHNWRLPTDAELKIIFAKQGASGATADAIDYLLNANYYWSAMGYVENNQTEYQFRGTASVRCIRDATEEDNKNSTRLE